MAEKAKISQRLHPLYEDHIDLWELYKSAADGGEDFINDTNLYSHRLEDGTDFDERLDRAYFLNFCDTIPSIFNTYIYQSNIEKSPDDILDEFRKNCDGKGTTINEFIKNAGYLASVYGVIHIFIDMPTSKTGKAKLSKLDVKQENLIPYLKLIHPTQLKDWSVDSKGNYQWVIIESNYYKDIDPTVEREEELHYRVVTTEKWWVEDSDGNKVKYDDGSESQGTNDLGFIPIVTMYHKDVGDNKIGRSLLKDIVYINRTIFNWCSCIDEQIERQTFSQLTMPDDGSLAELAEEGQDPLHQAGTSSILTYNMEAKNPPQFISPDTETIQTVWTLILDHIKEIYRLAGLQGGTSDLYTSRSGRQSQMSFIGVNSTLAEKSGTYEKCENDISKIVYVMMGKDPSTFQQVHYPKSFDVIALNEEIDNYIKIMERNFSPSFNKELQKDIARRALATKPNDIRQLIEGEIDSGTGIVEPLKGGSASTDNEQEKNGDGNPNTNQSDSFKGKKELNDEETKKEKKKE